MHAGDYQALGLKDLAAHPEVDLVWRATSGLAALPAVLAAVGAGKVVALANKESLVSCGELLLSEARKSGAEIRPVDSEHSAIWQCLRAKKRDPIRLILTAPAGLSAATRGRKLPR